MEFGIIFIESLAAIRKNTIIMAPTIIASLIMLIATSVFLGGRLSSIDETNPEKAVEIIKAVAPDLLIITAINYFLQVFAHCVTIVMAKDILSKGSCNVFDAYFVVLRKLFNILPASLLVLISLTLGLMLLILPALYVCFAFLLTFVIIMTEDIDPVMAMKKSYHTMKANFSSSIVLFFFLLSIGITVNILHLLVGQMLYVGVMLSLILSGAFMSFAALTLL
ncbi:MAG: hypothetical protein L7F77_16090, partial [Candidatus Magnetominusculus sp. LBB02]|nr:hypothetical protein [Candidatus Magnetominusculus sp. LBB02]